MDDASAVLAANQAFYDAFTAGDAAAMAAVWAEAGPVVCIHPGGPALHGRDLVLESWRQILGAAERPRIRCRGAEAFLMGEAAYVICYEEMPGGVLVATNIFARHFGQWRMVHHQAGPTIPVAPPSAAPTPRVLH